MEHKLEIELKLTVDEVTAIMQLMSQTQTGSGFYPLMVKVKEQVESQMEKDENGN